MDNDKNPPKYLENTIDKIDKLYTEKEWSEATQAPVPVEDYAQTATGKSLADLIDEMGEGQDRLPLATGGASLAEKTAPPHAPANVVDLDPGNAGYANREPADERPSVLFADTRRPLDLTIGDDDGFDSADDEIARIMLDFDQRIRAYVESAIRKCATTIERRHRDQIKRLRENAKSQIREQEVMLRRSYEASYKKKEQLLRGHYKKLMKLANKISEQKAQVQQARKQFEQKLHAANELYRQVEDMRRLLREHLGGLEQPTSKDMGRVSAS